MSFNPSTQFKYLSLKRAAYDRTLPYLSLVLDLCFLPPLCHSFISAIKRGARNPADMKFLSKSLSIGVQPRGLRVKPRTILLSAIILFASVWTLLALKPTPARERVVDAVQLRVKYPLTYRHIHSFEKGKGGGKANLLSESKAFQTLRCQSHVLASGLY